MKGREDVLRNCPEEFKDELEDYINDIESQVKEVYDLLNIDSTDDIYRIHEAKRLAEEICKQLY